VVENKTTEDVQRLSEVGEAVGVVREEAGGVVLALQDSFAEEHERPGGREAMGRFPFVPNSLVGFPRALGHGALKEAVLGKFLGARVANFALREDPHELKPRADREALVEGKPDEGAHFPWAGVVPNSKDGLWCCSVLKVETLNESDHAGSARWFLGVVVSSFGSVAKERSVP